MNIFDIVEKQAEMYYACRICSTKTDALKKSAKDLKAYEYIAKIGSLYDVEFN